MKKLLLAPALAMCLNGCAPALLGALMGGAGTPPQAPAAVTNISRTALDFALNSFDAALYGLDFAMDAGSSCPGSDNAKRIAAAGRKVMGFLGVADAAQKLGTRPTYEEAFSDAKGGAERVPRPCAGPPDQCAAAMAAEAADQRRAPRDPPPARDPSNHLKETIMSMFDGLLSKLGNAAAEMAERFIPGSAHAIEAAQGDRRRLRECEAAQRRRPRPPPPRRITTRCSPR
jgi:hypothetical protein